MIYKESNEIGREMIQTLREAIDKLDWNSLLARRRLRDLYFLAFFLLT